jgi:hypothetical protein
MCPVGAELFHADGRTDGRWDIHDEANSGFPEFYERAKKKKTAEHSDQRAKVSPLTFSKHPLRIPGRAPIILPEVVRDFPQTPYSTFKYLITVFFLALSSLPNPIIMCIIQNTITAAAVTSLRNLRLSKYFMKSFSLKNMPFTKLL